MNRDLSKSVAQDETTTHDQPFSRLGNSVNGPESLWSAFRGKWPLAAGLLIGLSVGYAVSGFPIAKQPEPPSMSQCVTDTLGSFGQKNIPTPETLRDAREHCYSLIQAQGLLDDFGIRKLNYFQQYRANGVLMWMVVVVTFSGVLLAALQLWSSYQLALANKTSLDGSDGEIILRGDQLVLKSSVTGLFILLISFCFFLVFVFYVYRFETLENHAGFDAPPVPTLPMGALGPPPSTEVKP